MINLDIENCDNKEARQIIEEMVEHASIKFDIKNELLLVKFDNSVKFGAFTNKPKKPTIYLNDNYFIWGSYGSVPDCYYIEEKNLYFPNTMFHELVHFKQYIKDGLSIKEKNETEDYITIEFKNETFKYHTDFRNWGLYEYYDLPFEKEAFILQNPMMEEYKALYPNRKHHLTETFLPNCFFSR